MPRTAGCRFVDLTDPVQRAAIPLAFLYPAQAEEATRDFGPYPLEVALDAPPSGRGLPLIVLSHGNNGTPWAYRHLAANLARAGFVVAMPEHPGNSRSDGSLAGTLANLENRPRHIARVIDAALADPVLSDRIDAARIGVIGHSIGGYTALCLAGGRPWAGPPHHPTPDGRPAPVAVEPDARVRAIALLAPATFWFAPEGSLSAVTVPILLRAGERDAITPPFHAERVLRGVGSPQGRVDFKIVAGAGHFSFMSPFPPAMARADFPPSQDPPGFDRPGFQPLLLADVRDFFLRAL